jgi:hypothetical protein
MLDLLQGSPSVLHSVIRNSPKLITGNQERTHWQTFTLHFWIQYNLFVWKVAVIARNCSELIHIAFIQNDTYKYTDSNIITVLNTNTYIKQYYFSQTNNTASLAPLHQITTPYTMTAKCWLRSAGRPCSVSCKYCIYYVTDVNKSNPDILKDKHV